jgi:uncharacterized protein YndB with AHSA1/START domain
MPAFSDRAVTAAPPEEVWKVLYDPTRIPEWWEGVVTAEPEEGRVTLYVDGYPDFPMPQLMDTSADDRSVRFSCTLSEMDIEWRLAPSDAGGTEIAVHVVIPEREAHRLEDQRAEVAASIRNLAEVACRS